MENDNLKTESNNANVLLCAGRYEIQFAYGGRCRGEAIHTVVIEGKDQKEALANFKISYRYELIIHCKELYPCTNLINYYKP